LGAFERGGALRTPVRFTAIDMPALVLVGKGDRLIRPPQELAARLPRARLEWVPGDHLSAVGEPESARRSWRSSRSRSPVLMARLRVGRAAVAVSAVALAACVRSAARPADLEDVRDEVLEGWRSRGVPGGTHLVKLRLFLHEDGSLRYVESLDSSDWRAKVSCIDALHDAEPFAPMEGAVRCLANMPLVLTFTLTEQAAGP